MRFFWHHVDQYANLNLVELNSSQRELIADKLMDSANLALAGLVFGQLVTDRIQQFLIALGLALYIGGWIISVRFTKGVKENAKP